MAITKNSQIDLNGNEMILDADADTKIDAATDDEIHFTVGGSETVYMGVTSYNASDRIVLTNTSGNASMAIVAGTSGESSIFMADGTSGDASYRGYLQYQHANDNWNFGTAATLAMKIDSAGHVTKPLQPSVHVQRASTQANIPVATDQTVEFNSELFDVNSDFNTGTYTFTAPVTGKYLVSTNVRMESVPTDFQYYYLYLVTSNGNRWGDLMGQGSQYFSSAPLYVTMGFTCVADMDANDTAFIRIYQGGGTAQMDIDSNSNFCIQLLS